MQAHLGLREKNKMYWPHKKSDPLFQISFLFLRILSKIPSIKILHKSEARKRLFFVCNNNKAFRTKKKKWQTVDASMKWATPETDESRSRKITFCEKHKRHSKTLRKERMLKQDENALKRYLQGRNICVAMWTFFFLVKISSMLLCLARGKINKHTRKCACLF